MTSESSGWNSAVAFADRAIERLSSLGVPSSASGAELLSKRELFVDPFLAQQVSMGGFCRLIPAADGWCAVHLPREDDLELLPAWVGIEMKSTEIPWEAIESALAARTSGELVEAAQELGLAVAALPGGDDEQLIDRSTTNVARPWIQRSVGQRQSGMTLNDAVVVDLSSLWAGPLCSRILTTAGARVIKVESSSRPDASRDGDRDFFDWLHDGHEFRTIEFESAAGRSELVELLEHADIVIEGSRPRALERLGIVPSEFVEKRPGKVWLSITAYGRCGPWRNWVGFGDDAAVAGGLVDVAADGTPSFVGDAVADPLTGLLAAALVAGSVARGGGVTIDVALREVARSAAHSTSVVW
ncbi:MAG: CoA transferase [Actinobacteria bacterium]|nr:CoA transferase [Actinomycetota bacterium]